MSRKVIEDIVIPIVSRLMSSYGIYPGETLDVHDKDLEEFLEQQLNEVFKPAGKAGECKELERIIKEARQRDQTQFDLLIERLVHKYVKLKTALRKKKATGPPDRFAEQRKRAKEVWAVYSA